MAMAKLLLMDNLRTKPSLLSQRRRKVIKITVIASDTGIYRLTCGIAGWRNHHRTVAVSVKIAFNALRIAASTIADKRSYSLFRTVCFLQYIRSVLMRMRGRRRSCRCARRCRLRTGISARSRHYRHSCRGPRGGLCITSRCSACRRTG